MDTTQNTNNSELTTLKEHPPKLKNPFRWLWILLIKVVVDAILFGISIGIDVSFWGHVAETSDTLGHGMPLFSLLAGLLCVATSIIVVIIVVVLIIVSFIVNARKKAKVEQNETQM